MKKAKENDDFGMFSPIDDKEYNYLFDLIDNEYSIEEGSNEPRQETRKTSSKNRSNEKILSKDPSIVYNDDNKAKLDRSFSSSFELSGVWKHFIVPYTTDSPQKTKINPKDCV